METSLINLVRNPAPEIIKKDLNQEAIIPKVINLSQQKATNSHRNNRIETIWNWFRKHSSAPENL